MKRKNFFICGLLILLVIVGITYFSRPIKLSNPDKIIIYNGDKIKELDSKSESFNEIVTLTNQRFNINMSSAKDEVNDKAMGDIRNDGLGIEFYYSKEQSMSRWWSSFGSFSYNRLYFPITSKRYNNDQGSTVYYFQHGDLLHYIDSSKGTLKYSDDLVKLVETIIKSK